METLLSINTDSEIFRWAILPVLIFLARITDQSIGTLRLMFVAKGIRNLATALGFLESLIWLLAVSQIFQHLDNPMTYIAYAGGYAMGNYIGIFLESKMSIGNVMVRIVPKKDTTELLNFLRSENFAVTSVDGEGYLGPVKVLFSVVSRKELKHFIEIVNRYNPNAFYTIEDVKTVKQSVSGRREEKKKSVKEIMAGIKKVK
ncbi:MAG: DUF2179 domain-containing protein [Bacteroidales bacterium]|nr:DUF2179 domain-containing protein [Bacteroidales bacterium]